MTIVAATVRGDVVEYINALFLVYIVLIFAYIVSNLILSFGGRIPYNRVTNAVLTFLREVTEPYLRLFRRVLPMAGPLDFSPIIGIFVLYIARYVIDRIILGA